MDDRTTPTGAYETFRGAIARAEFNREWDCISDPMRKRLGLRSRGDWKDARAVVLDQRHILVKGICRSSVEGEPEVLADGRVRLELDFPLGYEGAVWMRPVLMLRAFVAGETEPRIFVALPRLQLSTDRAPQRGRNRQPHGTQRIDTFGAQRRRATTSPILRSMLWAPRYW